MGPDLALIKLFLLKEMSSLESLIASSGEQPLADSLDFSLPPSSTAIVDRRQHVRAYPTSASSLSVNGTRTVRIRLGGDEFVDPHSIRLQFTIVNGDGTRALLAQGGPWCFWQQVYLRSGGCEIEMYLFIIATIICSCGTI